MVEQRDSHTDMVADLVTCNNIAGVFQGGRKPGGQCQHQSGALLATWSRLLLPPIPPTQSSSTLTRSPPQLSHNGLLARTAQASTTSPDLSVTMHWDLHCITSLLCALWPALEADCAQEQFCWMPSRQTRTTFPNRTSIFVAVASATNVVVPGSS